MTENELLGTCPNCGNELRPGAELIRYERSDDSTGIYADCSMCGKVVRPETCPDL